MLQRVYKLFGDDESADVTNLSSPSNDTSQNHFDEVSSLSWNLRVQYFLGCFCLSVICSLAGSALLFTWRVIGFTVMVSLGSILSLCGDFMEIVKNYKLTYLRNIFICSPQTCFLMGPLIQLQKMFEQGRFLASLMYLLSITFTLIAGLVFWNPALALVFVIGQYIAMAWYSITYIPFAREVVSSFFCNCFN